MKKHIMPEMKEGGVNVTPLIDIVMCLIIFFMLVAKIGVSRGVDKDIQLPNAILGTTIKDMGDTFTLNVHHTVLSGDPQVTAMVGTTPKEVKLTDGKDTPLLRVLKEFKHTHDKAQVIIRGDKDLNYGQLELVLMAVATAGITDTAYETKQGEDAPDAAAPVAAAQ